MFKSFSMYEMLCASYKQPIISVNLPDNLRLLTTFQHATRIHEGSIKVINIIWKYERFNSFKYR